MRLRPSSYFVLGIIAFMAYAFVTALGYSRMQAKFYPLVLSGIITVLAVVQLVRELRSSAATSSAKKEEQVKDRDELKRLGGAAAWFLGLAVASYLVGFLVAIGPFTAAYIKTRGRSWKVAVSVAIGMLAFIYIVFEVGFRFRLYRGLIGSL